jgi:hypothetical protein
MVVIEANERFWRHRDHDRDCDLEGCDRTNLLALMADVES